MTAADLPGLTTTRTVSPGVRGATRYLRAELAQNNRARHMARRVEIGRKAARVRARMALARFWGDYDLPEKTFLTGTHRALFDFIVAHRSEFGRAPSFPEMRAAMGWGGNGNLVRCLCALEDAGLITRPRRKRRGIELVSPAALSDAA